ncbi:hypothetical protein JCM8547_002891 [Rhodosporidiobolus lusitaniae]
MPRSRSSTLLSTTSTEREFYASNPSSLLPSPTPPPLDVAAFHLDTGGGEEGVGAPKSYRSEHSLRTIRGGGRGGGGEGSSDEAEQGDEEEGDSGITLSGTHAGAGGGASCGAGLPGRRTGPQFVIDLPSSSSSSESPSQGRPRASTFGGIELPPSSPYPLSSSSTDDALPAPATSSRPTRPSLGARGRSTSLSSLSSLRGALNPSLHLGGAPLRERRPVLYAGLQAGGLLLVSVLGLWVVLRTLLPAIEEEHKADVKVPKSFEELKRLNEVLQVYRARNNWRVMGCYVTVYLFLQAFSIPGSMYLSILGGALWGVLVALPLVCFCVASGALLCYLMSSALGPAVLLHSEVWQRRVDAWTTRVAEHRSNLVSYLIVLRIAPLPPHWVVNVVAPHLGISIWTFWISTFFGIAGVSYIHTQIGTTLDQLSSADDFHLISWRNGLGLGGIILAVLLPVLLRRLFAKDLADAASDPALDQSREPSQPLLHPRESLQLDPDEEGWEATGTGRQRSSTDGSAWVPGRGGRYVDEQEDGGEELQVGGGNQGGGSGRPVLNPVGGGSADKVSRVLGVQVR